MLSLRCALSISSSSSSPSSSGDSEKRNASANKEILAARTSLAKTSRGDGTAEGSDSASKSESYFVSQEDQTTVAAELGVSGAKLIGGRFVSGLHFESSDRECGFVSEAGETFYFPLIEKELMKTGVANMLWCAQDLSLKAMIATRCAERQLQAKGSSRVQLEEKIAELEQQKKRCCRRPLGLSGSDMLLPIPKWMRLSRSLRLLNVNLRKLERR